MSLGASQPQTQTVKQTTELPPWVTAAGMNNYADATTTANNLAAPFTGNTVAPFNQTQQDAWGTAIGASQSAQPLIGAGAGAVGAATNFNPSSVTPGSVSASTITPKSFLNGNLSAYMNPYTDQVVNASLGDLDNERLKALNVNADTAISQHAFGGSRQGVMEGVTNAEAARAAGTLGATLRGQAFDRAAGLLQQDNASDLQAQTTNAANGLTAGTANLSAGLQAQLANQNAGLTANQQRILGGTALGNLGTAAQTAGLQGAGVVEGIGNTMQAHEGALLGQDAANYNAVRGFPLEQLNIKTGALAATPYGKDTSTTGPATQQGANPLLGALGGASTGASIASTLGLSGALGGYGGAAGAGLGGLMGLLALSDETTKTDIKKVGTDPKTKLPLYSYRYKGDPKSYPKVVGPMAQDVQRKFPHMVKRLPGGKLSVHGGFLSAVAAA